MGAAVSVIEAVDVKAGLQPADILARQREAFLRAGPPDLAERKDDIKRLRAAVKQEAEADRIRHLGGFRQPVAA